MGCYENNLKNIDVRIPLNRWVVISGVSGCGKSSLVQKTIAPVLQTLLSSRNNQAFSPMNLEKVQGAHLLKSVQLLDQSPIGKSSRSNPATFLKIWDDFREIYALQPKAKAQGMSAKFFSFNLSQGRCPHCEGEGELQVDLQFLSNLTLPCEACGGKRFKDSVLEIKVREKSVFDLLMMTVSEVKKLWIDHDEIRQKCEILENVGLGYLQLGQSSLKLSGGESQRLKIAQTLSCQEQGPTLYLFDEPSTGLHPHDIQKLMDVFDELLTRGHTLVIIEHHLDLISAADWVIDLGPEGGKRGGQINFEGTPTNLANHASSLTGEFLRKRFLKAHV